jgi:hypothetical protein
MCCCSLANCGGAGPCSSPFWNLHFQFSSDVVVDGVQIYQFPSAANADGETNIQ